MRFLITGANGFIGSYLSKYLLDKGHEIIATSRKFIPQIKEVLNGAEFIEKNILDPEFADLKVNADAVIHLAASNDIVSKDRAKGIELSSIGTVNALNLCVNNKIDKFIFFSTLQVYGTELSGTYSEDSPVKPENDYSINHLFGEMYAEMYSRKHDLKIIVARPSNIYGRVLSADINRWTLVPGCFCKEALEKGTITLLSSGNQKRNFISLELLSEMTLETAQNMNKSFDILNYVSNDYYSIREVAEMTKNVFRTKFNMEIELVIKSDMPKEKNNFEFSDKKLKSYQIDPGKLQHLTLLTEIEQIIKTLSAKPNAQKI